MFCAVVLDAHSRRDVGWPIDSSQTAALATNALGMAITNRSPSRPRRRSVPHHPPAGQHPEASPVGVVRHRHDLLGRTGRLRVPAPPPRAAARVGRRTGPDRVGGRGSGPRCRPRSRLRTSGRPWRENVRDHLPGAPGDRPARGRWHAGTPTGSGGFLRSAARRWFVWSRARSGPVPRPACPPSRAGHARPRLYSSRTPAPVHTPRLGDPILIGVAIRPTGPRPAARPTTAPVPTPPPRAQE